MWDTAVFFAGIIGVIFSVYLPTLCLYNPGNHELNVIPPDPVLIL